MTGALLYPEESYAIRGASFEVYTHFRNGHKEVIYQRAMMEALRQRGFAVEAEYQMPVFFNGKKIGSYTPDIVVAGKIVVELKAKPVMHRDDILQFWHYLKASPFRVGYLINFGARDGVQIVRRVYDTARDR